jgi:hypothetical protein
MSSEPEDHITAVHNRCTRTPARGRRRPGQRPPLGGCRGRGWKNVGTQRWAGGAHRRSAQQMHGTPPRGRHRPRQRPPLGGCRRTRAGAGRTQGQRPGLEEHIATVPDGCTGTPAWGGRQPGQRPPLGGCRRTRAGARRTQSPTDAARTRCAGWLATVGTRGAPRLAAIGRRAQAVLSELLGFDEGAEARMGNNWKYWWSHV